MEKPKDIAAGDWDTAFALCEQEGFLPCSAWQEYLRKYRTVSEAFAGPGPWDSENGHGHAGSYAWADVLGRVRPFRWYTDDNRATPDAVSFIITGLRDRLLAK